MIHLGRQLIIVSLFYSIFHRRSGQGPKVKQGFEGTSNDQTKLTESGAGGESPRFYALLLLEAMAEIFQDSLLRDVADTIFQPIPSDRSADSLKHAHEIL